MKVPAIQILTLTLALQLASSCQEIYEPRILAEAEVLVVEGTITTDSGPHIVMLSMASRFDGHRHRRPVYEARIWIEDCHHQTTPLEHFERGSYLTPPGFKGEEGRTYTLHIETSDGQRYVSRQQEILPAIDNPDFSGSFGTDYRYEESGVSGRIIQREYEGGFVFIDAGGGTPETPPFRFTSTLYLQYSEMIGGGSFPGTFNFCWITRDITHLADRNVSSQTGVSMPSAFVPWENHVLHHYEFPQLVYNSPRIVIQRVYTLNRDSYAFHAAKNDQLGDEGRIFDPVAAQLPGNIECITDPGRPVFGHFEASSLKTFSHRVFINRGERSIEVTPTAANMDTIPPSGCLHEAYPPFWVF